jgi:nucleotide-binding universal stress UspA family protein
VKIPSQTFGRNASAATNIPHCIISCASFVPRTRVDLPPWSAPVSPPHAETDADRRESSDAAHRHLEQTFDEIKDRAQRAGVDVEHQVIEGDTPARALLDHAHEHGFDLIVCGHHPTRRAGRLLLHDVADDLYREALTPVLVVGENAGR